MRARLHDQTFVQDRRRTQATATLHNSKNALMLEIDAADSYLQSGEEGNRTILALHGNFSIAAVESLHAVL